MIGKRIGDWVVVGRPSFSLDVCDCRFLCCCSHEHLAWLQESDMSDEFCLPLCQDCKSENLLPEIEFD